MRRASSSFCFPVRKASSESALAPMACDCAFIAALTAESAAVRDSVAALSASRIFFASACDRHSFNFA